MCPHLLVLGVHGGELDRVGEALGQEDAARVEKLGDLQRLRPRRLAQLRGDKMR